MLTQKPLRQEIVTTARALQAKGLVRGTSGNVSARCENGILITPTGIPYDVLQPEHIVEMDWNGLFTGEMRPSSEWRFHLGLLRTYRDFNAVVHTHSIHATALSVLNRDIPAIHYRIAAVGGASIPCSDYATFGSEELADQVVRCMQDRRGCLLAHHGVVAAHDTLAGALNVAEVIEEMAELYLLCAGITEPPTLDADEIAKVIEKHKTYGQQPRR